MEEIEYIYVIYEGCFHEGLYASEFYRDKERAIKFALIRLEERKNEFKRIHGKHEEGEWENCRWAFKENHKAYELSQGNVILCWQNCIDEVSLCRQKLL